MKLPAPALALSILTTSAVVTSQGASFTEYGSGCLSSGHTTCPISNPGAAALVGALTNNPQWALEVPGSASVVTSFEIFTQSRVKQNITAWILKPDAQGKPDHANPLGTGTLSVDTKLGWYRASFSNPVVVGNLPRYFLSWDNGSGQAPMTADPTPRLGAFSPYMAREIVNNQLTWVTPRALKRWAFKVNCRSNSAIPRVSAVTQPAPGNSKFEVLLSQAAGKVPAVAILGDSDKKWGPAALPLGLAPLGAPKCSLLSSVLILAPTATDVYGQASFPLPIPNNPKLKGLKFYVQWMVADAKANAFAWIFSNGGRIVVGDEE